MMAEQKEKGKSHCCPYCDEEMRASDFPWCQTCGLTICPNCQKSVPWSNKVCPNCGAEIKS